MENTYIPGPMDILFYIILAAIMISLIFMNPNLYKYVIFVILLLLAIKIN